MSEVVRDKTGHIRYMVRIISRNQKQIVDGNGNYLGSIRDGMTYGRDGSFVAAGEDIAALLIRR